MQLTINQISSATAISIFIVLIIYNLWKKKKVVLSDVVIATMAGGMLPIAICLVLYPFFPSLIGSIENMSLQLTLTGLILIFVYTKTIFEKTKPEN